MDGRQNRREALMTLLATGASAVAAPAWAQGLDLLPDAALDVSVLFYNTHLLPTVAQAVAGKRGQDAYRTAAIARQLDRYDLVGLSEVFEARRRDEIIRTVQQNSGDAFNWVASPKPKGRSLVSGGLLLLTRFPIEGEPNFLAYSAASRVYSHGIKADGLAAKGVLHARLRVGDEPQALVDCFLTHLESISAKARAKQVQQLGAFIAEHASPERPMLLMGDMNIAADFPGTPSMGPSEYRMLLDTLRHGDKELVDLWAASHVTRGGTRDALARENCNRIDYIFLSPPDDDGSISWQPAAVRVEPFLDARVKQGSLSDHAAVECCLSIRRNDWAAWYR